MRHNSMAGFSLLLIAWITITGCSRPAAVPAVDRPPAVTASEQPKEMRAEDLVGTWWLVRAGGKPPAEVFINSQRLDFAADGTWKCQIVWQGALAGMTMTGGGTWSLVNGSVHFTNGVDKGESRVSLSGAAGPRSGLYAPQERRQENPGRRRVRGGGDSQRTGHSPGTRGPSDLRGVQPGRQDAGRGKSWSDVKVMGRRDGEGTGNPQRTRGRSGVPGLQSGRQDAQPRRAGRTGLS